MCRLSAFFGPPICAADLVTRPSRSIITQSFDARERMTGDASTPAYLNGDGFGLGWYSLNTDDDTVPCIYKQARPAWNDPNLSSIAEKLYTRLLFAHVRAASAGLDVSESTCHPFKYGRYLFMHNGGLGGFAKLRRHILPLLNTESFDFAVTYGCSDTALCFAIFLHLLNDDPMKLQSPDKLRICLEKTIGIVENIQREHNIEEVSLLNFVVSDGYSLIATRYVINLKNPVIAMPASLYYATGNSYELIDTPGSYVMKHTDRRNTLTIISSEPLTENRADWISVPKNFCIVVTKSMHVLLSAIRPSPPIEKPDDIFSRILANLLPVNSNNDYKENNIIRRNSSNKMISRDAITRQRSNQQLPTIICQDGAAVRSSITVPNCIVLCCTVLKSYFCSGTNDGHIYSWNMEQNCKHSILTTNENAIQAILGDSQNNLLICGTSVSTVLIFKLSTNGQFVRSLDICCGGMGNILSLSKVGDSLFAGFSDAGLRCVIADLNKYSTEEHLTSSDNDADDNSDNLICTGNGFNTVPVINIKSVGYDFPKGTDTIVHKGFIYSLVSFEKGKFLCSGCGDGVLRIWNVNEGKCVQTINDHAGAILMLAIYEVEKGTMLFSGSRDCSVKVWLWDGDHGFICKRTLRKHKDEVIFLAIAGNNLISGSADGAVYVWSAETLQLICHYHDNGLKTGGVSYEYNSLFTATNEDGIQIRDIISTERDLIERDHQRSSWSFDEQDGKEENRLRVLATLPGKDERHSVHKPVSNGNHDSTSAIVSERDDDSDDFDTLTPCVEIEQVLAPPMESSPSLTSESISELNDGQGENGTDVNHNFLDEHNVNVQTNGNVGKKQDQDNKSPENKILSHVFEQRLIEDALRKFISFATVSNSKDHRQSCWEGARCIGRFLEVMGASVKFVNTSSRNGYGDIRDDIPSNLSKKEMHTYALECETNPIVLAKFASANPKAKTITFYGHYDVMPAMDLSQWQTNPWEMKGIDGYFYGRGTTDNKGPIIAMIFAVKKLMEQSINGLGVNIVLVLQGEGEASNAGFRQCISSHLHWFENTCLILTSNSIWLGENRPCLTYGFRGIIDLLVSVTGGHKNLHSGVDGGAIFEPMNDLITVLATLVDASGVVCVPGFYDDVRNISEEERTRLHNVDFDIDEYRRTTGVNRFTVDGGTDVLECRWHKPSVSISSIETTNTAGFYSVVPQKTSAKISIRFVPDQDPSKIEKAVRTHLQHELRKRRSPNTLNVECVNKGDWWLRDPSGEEFQVAAKAVKEVWGVDAEYVCEGGSMPLFSFLAKTLKAPLVQVPLGQSSDGAHLPNERIRAMNLFRGKEVLQRIISDYSNKAKTI